MPNQVFHGTQMKAIPGIRQKPINKAYCRANKDFGSGFYTTIDLYQATRWARKSIDDVIAFNRKMGQPLISNISEGELPAVAVLNCEPDGNNLDIPVHDFRAESKEWADFILKHRFDSSNVSCNCSLHPDIVCGVMADNNTGDIIAKFRKENRQIDNPADLKWFWERITLSQEGRRLIGLELGDQIAFLNEDLNEMLTVKGYYKYNLSKRIDVVTPQNYTEEWDYYEN
nr:DUF3990 domain-containing protein [Cohnella zeiphila]